MPILSCDLMEEINNIKSFLLTPMILEESIKSIFKSSRLKKLQADSKLISGNFELDSLNSWLNYPNLKTNLLYRASVDGFTSDVFHSLCDNRGPTLTLIKSNRGKVFGGFTTVSWKKNGGYQADEEAFIFSLTHRKRFRIYDT